MPPGSLTAGGVFHIMKQNWWNAVSLLLKHMR